MRARALRWATVIFILFYLPVVILLLRTIGMEDAGQKWGELLFSPLFRRALSFTAGQALISAVGSVLLAMPGAYFLGNYSFPGRSLIRSLLILPFVLPGILVVLGFIIFYGRNGILNNLLVSLNLPWRITGLYGLTGIVMAHVFYNAPLATRIISEAWDGLDPAHREAAAVLGSGPLDVFRRITLPLLAPAVAQAFLNTFIYSFLSFTVVLVFGGYTYRTFEVLIYIFANQRLDFQTMQMIAAVQLILLSLMITAVYRYSKTRRTGPRKVHALPRLSWRRTPWALMGFLGYGTTIAFFFGGPLAGVVLRSFHERGLANTKWTLYNYRTLVRPDFESLVGWEFFIVVLQSIILALSVGSVCVTIAYLLSRKRRNQPFNRLDTFAKAPLGISLLTFAFGLYAFAGGLIPPWGLVLWTQVFMGFPVVYSMLRMARQTMGETPLEAAAVLGASPWQCWKTVEGPLMATSLGVGFAYAAAFSLGDLSAVLTLGEGTMMTLPLATYRLIGQYRFPQALALGTVFMVCAVLVFLAIDRGSRNRPVTEEGEWRDA